MFLPGKDSSYVLCCVLACAGLASAALKDGCHEESSQFSPESEKEAQLDMPRQQQQQQRPLSSSARVMQGNRLKPPLAPKQPPKGTAAAAAAPAQRSFLKLTVPTCECRVADC